MGRAQTLRVYTPCFLCLMPSLLDLPLRSRDQLQYHFKCKKCPVRINCFLLASMSSEPFAYARLVPRVSLLFLSWKLWKAGTSMPIFSFPAPKYVDRWQCLLKVHGMKIWGQGIKGGEGLFGRLALETFLLLGPELSKVLDRNWGDVLHASLFS